MATQFSPRNTHGSCLTPQAASYPLAPEPLNILQSQVFGPLWFCSVAWGLIPTFPCKSDGVGLVAPLPQALLAPGGLPTPLALLYQSPLCSVPTPGLALQCLPFPQDSADFTQLVASVGTGFGHILVFKPVCLSCALQGASAW